MVDFVFDCCCEIVILEVWLVCKFEVVVFCIICVLDLVLLGVFLIEEYWDCGCCERVVDDVWDIDWNGDLEFVWNFVCDDNNEFKFDCVIDWVLFCGCVLVFEGKFFVGDWSNVFKF